MNKKRSRRQQIALRSFTYGMMTIAVLFGVIFSFSWAMGFRFDMKSKQVSQVALLQFASTPSGARIDVNRSRLSSSTPTRTNIASGDTTVNISLEDYRTWSKTINAAPSSVRWINYIRLIPKNVTTESIKNFAQINTMFASPNKKWLLLQQISSDQELTLANISNPLKVEFSTIKFDLEQITSSENNQSEKFEIIEWDQNSRYILVKHVVDDTTEFLRLDRQNPTETKNLTRDFGMNIKEAHFSGANGNLFFGLTDRDLRKFDYNNKTATAPLVNDVDDFRLYKNNIFAYVSSETKDDKKRQKVGIYDDGKSTIIKTYDDIKTVTAEFTSYEGKDYLAVARGETISIYPSPLDSDSSESPIYLSSPGGIDLFEFSPNGRFVVASKNNKIVSYDIETNENYSFEMSGKLTKFNWIDAYHLIDNSDKSISFMEFDGKNRERIVSGRSQATLSSNDKYMFSLGDTAGGIVLQRSQLILR